MFAAVADNVYPKSMSLNITRDYMTSKHAQERNGFKVHGQRRPKVRNLLFWRLHYLPTKPVAPVIRLAFDR